MGLCRDGYWREYESFDGKIYTGCGRTQKEALRDLANKIADAKAGNNVLNNNTTVKTWAETWLKTFVENKNITRKSYLNIKGKIERNVVDAIGHMKLKDVRDVHLQKILNAQAGMSMSHVSKLRAYMKEMFGRAVKARLIPYNPAEDLELPKAEDKKRRPLTPEEREVFLRVAEEHRAGLWIKTMLYCGLRPQETRALQWKDIDFSKRIIRVSKALESGTKDKIKDPKSEAGFRYVPIPDVLLEDLRKAKGKAKGDDYVFTQLKDKTKHHTESSMRSMWKSFLRAVDIEMGAKVYRNQIIESKVDPDLTPYNLRHTYGTDLQNAGVPINVAKSLLGHSDISTTANIYTHFTEDSVLSAQNLLNRYHENRGCKNDPRQFLS